MSRRVVFDCMVFVQAIARPNGPAAACINKARTAQCELIVSDAIITEAREVLSRPKLRKSFIRASDEAIDEFFAILATFVIRIDPVPEAFALKRDPEDSKYLNLAIVGDAELIVSRDNDLLDLMTSDEDEPLAFRTAYPTIRIVDPVAFLKTFPPPDATNPDEAS